MKKRVGYLNGTPIVEGDPNLLTNKELLHKGGGSLAKRDVVGKIVNLGDSNDGEEEFYYYKVNDDALKVLKQIDKSLDLHKPICRVFSEGPKPGGCIFYYYGLNDRRLTPDERNYDDVIHVEAGRIPTTYMFGYDPDGYNGYAKPAKVRIEDPKLAFIFCLGTVNASEKECYNFPEFKVENAEEVIASLEETMKLPEALVLSDLIFKGILEGHQIISSPVIEIITKKDYYNILEEMIKEIEGES